MRASGCDPAILIQWVTRGCRATHEGRLGRSTGIMEFLYFRTPTLCFAARCHSMCTQYASGRANCGANKRWPRTQFILICGTATLNQPNPILQREGLAALPRLPQDDEI